MKILGICHDVLICSACVVVDGTVVSAVPEERLDRVKQSRVFPRLAVSRCLEVAELKMTDLDEIAIAWNPARELETIRPGYLSGRVMRSEHMSQVPAQLMRLSGESASNFLSIGKLWHDAPPVTFIDHHLAHLANGFYLSRFQEAAVLVLDGYGEKTTGLWGRVDGTHVQQLGTLPFPHSLGMFYGAVTQFLGFRPDVDEWKVMALASYASGANEYYGRMARLIRLRENGHLTLDLDYFGFYNYGLGRWYSDTFVDAFGAPRSQNQPIERRHHEIASALQRVFEESVIHILNYIHDVTDLKTLVVSGGCFMNSVFNGKITRVTPFEECFVSSSPDDSGTSVGAALYLHATRTGRRPQASSHNYWGSQFSDTEILEIIRKYKIVNASVCPDASDAAADDIAQGKLVGWCQGRSEFGQRALGHRSILADPRRKDMKDLLNAAVKYREAFRPFAASILSDRVSEYFECAPQTDVPFMEKVLPFRKEVREKVPAVVHIDGTGRLQTVDATVSPLFHRLLTSFEQKTGVPMLLNTSFNVDGEPIVDSPTDAIRTFYSCGLDVLYLGSARIHK